MKKGAIITHQKTAPMHSSRLHVEKTTNCEMTKANIVTPKKIADLFNFSLTSMGSK